MENIEPVVGDVGSPEEVSASPAAAPAAKPVNLPEMVTIVVNGKPVEMTKEKAIALAQKGMASDEKFREAAKAKQEAEELLGAVKQKEFLKMAEKAGMSKAEAREALEKTLLALYEEESLSPEERELRELRQLKQQQEAAEQARKQAEEQERLTKEEQRFLEKLEHDLVTALEKSILPANPLFAKLSANYLSAAMANDVELSPAEAVKLVEQDQILLAKQLVGSLPVEKLEEVLGPKVVKAIRDAGVKAVKANEAKLKPATPTAAPKATPAKSEGPKKAGSVFDQIRKQHGVL